MCATYLEMLVRSVGEAEFRDASAFCPSAWLFQAYSSTPGQLFHFCMSCMFLLPVIDVCSLARVVSKLQQDGVGEIPSAAKAADSGAGASCSAPLTLQ